MEPTILLAKNNSQQFLCDVQDIPRVNESQTAILYRGYNREINPRPTKPDSYSHVLSGSQEAVVQRFD